MSQLFGTDGIRGPAGLPPLDESGVRALGAALVRWVASFAGPSSGRIVVGRDTRPSGPAITGWLADGIAAAGGHCLDIGIAPTPAIAWNGDRLGADLALAVTASHNPASDNGIKVFLPGCRKLSEASERAIEAELSGAAPSPSGVSPEGIDDAIPAYLSHLGDLFQDLDLRGLVLVVDTANGATAATTPDLLRKLGAKVHAYGASGVINDGVGSEHPDQLGDLVRKHQADLGVAHDGDGDRLVLLDGSGQVIPGDALLGLLAIQLKKRGEAGADCLVSTIQSNAGLASALSRNGIDLLRTPVGDRHVQAAMVETGAPLGGENSGHLIHFPSLPTGDGLVALLLTLRLVEAGSLGRAARSAVPLFPAVTRTVASTRKPPLEDCPGLSTAIDAAETALGPNGRILVRYSGTEPKLRILVEAPTAEEAAGLADTIAAAAQVDLAEA